MESEVLRSRSRKLRKEMTPLERHLWYDFLRDYSVRFRRQKVIGNYIVDFYCHQARLVVELDGSQHWEPEEIAYDTIRTAYLEKQGLRVVRYSNRQIDREFSGICENIHHIVWENMAIIDGKPPSFGGGVCDKGADEGGNNKE